MGAVVTGDELDIELTKLALIAMEMVDICNRIIAACDQRSAVRGWSDELGGQLEALAKAHQELNR